MCALTNKPLFTCGLGFYTLTFMSFSPISSLKEPVVLSFDGTSKQDFLLSLRFKPGQSVIDKSSGRIFAFDEQKRALVFQGLTGMENDSKQAEARGGTRQAIEITRTQNSKYSWLFTGTKKVIQASSGLVWNVPRIPHENSELQKTRKTPIPTSLAFSRQSIEVLAAGNIVAVRFVPDSRFLETVSILNNFTSHFFQVLQVPSDEEKKSIIQEVLSKEKTKREIPQGEYQRGYSSSESPFLFASFKGGKINTRVSDDASLYRSKYGFVSNTVTDNGVEIPPYSMMHPKQAVQTIKNKLSAIAKKETAENAARWVDPDQAYREENERRMRKLEGSLPRKDSLKEPGTKPNNPGNPGNNEGISLMGKLKNLRILGEDWEKKKSKRVQKEIKNDCKGHLLPLCSPRR